MRCIVGLFCLIIGLFCHIYIERKLFMWQKRPTNTGIPEVAQGVDGAEVRIMSKETYLHGKRDLLIRQKSPINMSIPEVCVCVSVKRDLL